MGATPNVSRCGEGWGAILLPSRFSGGGLFFMLAECRTWDTVPPKGAPDHHHPKCLSGHIWTIKNLIPRRRGSWGSRYEAIAKSIIELALAGERDADVLCDRTLIDLRAPRRSPGP